MADSSYVTTIRSQQAPLWKSGGPVLTRLDMELTERCNNNCVHCHINRPAHDAEARARELATDQLKRILEDAASLGCLTVRLTGGEPLLREDFEEVYLLARRLGLRVALFTNATLLGPHLADLFARIPPLEKVEISVYGLKRSAYEATTRQTGSFDAAMRGIGLLMERKIPFVVKNALLPFNKEGATEFARWASAIPGMERGPAYSLLLNLHCRHDPEKNRLIRELRMPPVEGVETLASMDKGWVDGIRSFCSRLTGPNGPRLFACGAGMGRGSVDPYGHFSPCLLLKAPQALYCLGNGSLSEAVSRFFPALRAMEAEDPSYIERCARCFLHGLCEQCPAQSWLEHGRMDAPVEYLCRIAHAKASLIGLIKSDERAWEIHDWQWRLKALSEQEAGGEGVEDRPCP